MGSWSNASLTNKKKHRKKKTLYNNRIAIYISLQYHLLGNKKNAKNHSNHSDKLGEFTSNMFLITFIYTSIEIRV